MKLKIYKATALLIALIFAGLSAFAQTAVAVPTPPKPAAKPDVPVNVHVNLNKLNNVMASINTNINNAVLTNLNKNIYTNINKNINNITKELEIGLDGLSESLSAINCDINVDIDGIDAAANNGDMEELTKTYSKSYSADANDMLDIDNRYGKVTVVTWNKNEFKVDVLIKVATNKEGAAKKMLDDVTIQDGKQGSTVWFKTRFAGDQGSGSWSFNGKRSVRIMEINYTIHMPARNAITVSNKYGTTELPSLYGKVNVTNAYGKFYAKSLNNISNNLNLSYTDASIDELKSGNVNFSYGDLKFGKIGSIDANVKYSPVIIKYLETSGDFNIKYGDGLKINELGTGLKSLNINSAYSDVGIALSGKDNFEFDVTVSYNSFNHDSDKVKIVDKTPDNGPGYQPTKNYKGYVGKSNSDTKVVIKNRYQAVNIE
ncbi:hypothetical protein EOD41_06410 [Mucilaginibacter limnophilus]|uniref:Adhesin domain-containing protein n=1 Tax=Mucilaginibacter limnophilus TaxID=1932778 RepID=A0A437MVA4_9SPHI|nr:hypothetical protein [Mucilaginibacter limnophilus]RVU01595.1 hypothetical protein EOD41_06410 [Mucilaginibacter limnophilus]